MWRAWRCPCTAGAVALAIGCSGTPADPAPTASVSAPAPALTMAPFVNIEASSPDRALAISLVRRAAGDLPNRRAGQALLREAASRAAAAESACEKNDVAACTLAGALLDLSLGPGEDATRMAGAFMKGCTAGDALACARVAWFWPCQHKASNLQRKVPCPESIAVLFASQAPGDKSSPAAGLEGARAIGQRACDAKEPVGCEAVAAIWDEAQDDRKHAQPAHEMACDLGLYLGCERAIHGARQVYEDSKISAENRKKWGDKALPMLLPACDGGDEQACVQIASFYEGGWGIPADMPKAKVFHLKACAAQVKESCDRAKMIK